MPIGNLSIDLKANVARFESDLKRANRIAKRQSAAMQRSFRRSARGISSSLGAGSLGVAGFVLGLRAAAKGAAEFQKAMGEVSTLLDDTSSMDNLTESVRAMSREFGQAPVEQARALYQIISAGASDAATQMDLLRQSNMLAIGGVTDVATAADALTTILNAYAGKVESAAEASDILFVGMKQGKTTIGEMGASIGQVATIAAQAGVGFHELVAAVATITKSGIDTTQAMQGLRGILSAVFKETQQSQEMARQLGIDFSAAALASEGLAAFLAKVGVAAEGDTSKLNKLFGRVEGLTSAMSILAGDQSEFLRILEATEMAAGETGKAYGKMADLADQRFKVLKESMRGVLLDLGDEMLPALQKIADELSGNLTPSTDDASEAVFGLGDALETAASAIVLIQGFLSALGKNIVGLAAIVGNLAQAMFAWLTGTMTALNNVEQALIQGGLKEAFKAALTIPDEVQKDWESALGDLERAVGFISVEATADIEEAFETVYRLMSDMPRKAKDAAQGTSVLGGAMKTMQDLAKGLVGDLQSYQEQMAEIKRDAEGAARALLTPLEQAQAEYVETNIALNNYLATLEEGSAEYARTIELIKRNNAAWLANRAAIQSALTPYEQLVQELEREIQLMRAGETERLKLIALWDLEAQGIEVTVERLREYMQLLGQYQALADQSIFGGGINSFQDLIQDAIEKGMRGGAKEFAKRIQAAWGQGVQAQAGIVEGVAGALVLFRRIKEAGASDLRALAEVATQFDPTGIAKALVAIDELFKGKLFGTEYATDQTILNLGIGQGGAFGGQQIFQSKERSFFRGTARRILEEALDPQAQEAITDLFDSIREAVGIAARALGTSIPRIVEGEFQQEFDAQGNLVKQFATVLGRTFTEGFEDFSRRLIAENLLATIGQSAGLVEVTRTLSDDEIFERFFGRGGGRDFFGGRGGFDERIGNLRGAGFGEVTELINEVDAIAERWRHDAELLLEGAEFLLAAQTDLNEGINLLTDGSLTDLTNLMEDLQRAGEALGDTYARVKADVEILENALGLMGTSLDLAREEFIRFAVGIEDAAGSLQRASDLWLTFFNTFFTESERVQAELRMARQEASSQVNALGILIGDFGDTFMRALPHLSPDDLVAWLEAGEAIARVIDLERQLAEQRAELENILADAGIFSSFEQAFIQLRQSFDESIQRAHQLGATERELYLIRVHATRQLGRLVAETRAETARLAQEFLGTNEIQQDRLAGLEAERDRILQIRQDREQALEAERAAIKRLKDFADSLLLNQQLTPLTPRDQLAEAQSQFQSLLRQARGGDTQAISRLPGAAQSLLGIARDFFASSPAFTRIFEGVQQALRGFNVQSETQALTSELVRVEGELAALRETMEQNSSALDAFNEALRIETLLENLRDLARFTGVGIDEVAGQFGLDVGALSQALTDLGLWGFNPGLILNAPAEDAMINQFMAGEFWQPIEQEFSNLRVINEDGFEEMGKGNRTIIEKLDDLIRIEQENRDLLSQRQA